MVNVQVGQLYEENFEYHLYAGQIMQFHNLSTRFLNKIFDRSLVPRRFFSFEENENTMTTSNEFVMLQYEK